MNNLFKTIQYMALVLAFGALTTPAFAAQEAVTVTKTGPATVEAGEFIMYQITVRNIGSIPADGIVTWDHAPLHTNAIAVSDGCVITKEHFPRGTMRCAPITLQPGKAHSYFFKVKVIKKAACGLKLGNIADIDFKGNALSDAWSNIVETKVVCPTPEPSPEPTPEPTPTPTPTPEVEVKDKGLRITKTDSRDVTRPGHSLTYVITVENTGEVDIHDLAIADTVPGQLENIREISHGGKREGSVIHWSNLTLGANQVKKFSFTATVKGNTANGHILHNDVTANSNDHDLSDRATDTTTVQRAPQVAAKVFVPVVPIPVPVTAKTGAGVLALTAITLGGAGLAATRRLW